MFRHFVLCCLPAVVALGCYPPISLGDLRAPQLFLRYSETHPSGSPSGTRDLQVTIQSFHDNCRPFLRPVTVTVDSVELPMTEDRTQQGDAGCGSAWFMLQLSDDMFATMERSVVKVSDGETDLEMILADGLGPQRGMQLVSHQEDGRTLQFQWAPLADDLVVQENWPNAGFWRDGQLAWPTLSDSPVSFVDAPNFTIVAADHLQGRYFVSANGGARLAIESCTPGVRCQAEATVARIYDLTF